MQSRGSIFALSAAAMLFLAAAAQPAVAAEQEAAVTCRVESPVDGSFWIGTSNDGLFRLGRNGRIVRYTAENGQLGSNSIKSLIFDNQKQLWILDSCGYFRTYSSLSGFVGKDNLPAGILAAAQGATHEEILFAAEGGSSDFEIALYSLNTSSEEYEMICILPDEPQSLCLSNSADEIWVFSENGVFKCLRNGAVLKWEDAPGVLNLLPFKYETNQPASSLKRRFSVPLWLFFLIVILVALAYWLFLRARSSKPSAAVEVAPESKPVVSPPIILPAQEPTLFPTSSDTSGIDGAFTKRVRALIKDNLSDPNFDVESIAALTGLSRIHVNRKLKAEGSDSPSSLIKDTRMSMASKLLKQGKLNVSQISSQCGFRTPSYFATAFKDYFGVSPSEFIAQSDEIAEK